VETWAQDIAIWVSCLNLMLYEWMYLFETCMFYASNLLRKYFDQNKVFVSLPEICLLTTLRLHIPELIYSTKHAKPLVPPHQYLPVQVHRDICNDVEVQAFRQTSARQVVIGASIDRRIETIRMVWVQEQRWGNDRVVVRWRI
jgi:hypothetical protein